MEIKGIKVEAISKLVKDVVIIVLAGVAILKMLQADIALSFSELSATDLVALLLAVFSVGLSAAFYFAASGSSERFYYNMHKFTKDTSVILGELKEQVKSVDKGQQEVKARVEQYGTNGVGTNNEALETKEKEVVDARKDMHQFISTLFEDLKLDQAEKDKLKAELASKEEQLSEHVNQLSEIKANIIEEKLRKVKRYLVGHVRRRAKRHDSFEELLEDLIPRSGTPFEEDLISLGWFEHGEFTSKGIDEISQMYADICDS